MPELDDDPVPGLDFRCDGIEAAFARVATRAPACNSLVGDGKCGVRGDVLAPSWDDLAGCLLFVEAALALNTNTYLLSLTLCHHLPWSSHPPNRWLCSGHRGLMQKARWQTSLQHAQSIAGCDFPCKLSETCNCFSFSLSRVCADYVQTDPAGIHPSLYCYSGILSFIKGSDTWKNRAKQTPYFGGHFLTCKMQPEGVRISGEKSN